MVKFVTFWRMQALELSLSERIFFRDAIRTLQAWETVKKEYAELELIRKILEAEINIIPVNLREDATDKKCGDIRHTGCSYIPHEKTP